MKIQVDIPEDVNKKLKIDKVNYDMNNLQEVIIENLRKFYKLRENKK